MDAAGAEIPKRLGYGAGGDGMSKKARKAYRPRILTVSTLLSRMVIRSTTEHNAPASQEKQDRVMMRFLSAIDSIARGAAPGNDDWYDLSDAINTVEIMCRRGVVDESEVMPTVNAAILAMRDCGVRFKAGHAMRMSGDGLQAVRDVVGIYADVMAQLSEADMAMLQCDTQEFVAAILAGNHKTDRTVVTV